MKHLSIISLVFLCFFSLTGCVSVPMEGEYEYVEIIESPGNGKDVLFDKSLKWLAETFKSSKAVIEYQNKDSGEIIGNGSLRVAYTAFGSMNTYFTLLIETKDGKLRMTFKNMRYDQGYSMNSKGQLDTFSNEAYNLVYSLKNYITKKNDSW